MKKTLLACLKSVKEIVYCNTTEIAPIDLLKHYNISRCETGFYSQNTPMEKTCFKCEMQN